MCVCLLSVLISVTLLPALVLCQHELRASTHFPLTNTHTQRVLPSLTTQSLSRAGPAPTAPSHR